MGFAKNLQEARSKSGMSQQDLADRVGSKKQNIAAYEQGRAEPDNNLLIKIAKVLTVSSEFLLGVEEVGGAKSIKDSVTYWESRAGHFTDEERKQLDKFIKELLSEADEVNRKNAIDVARVVLKQGKKKKE